MIPKIIHQVWEGRTEPLPEFLSLIGETWKEHHPQWQYEFWNGDRMENFVRDYFPDFSGTYYNYCHPVQRWDAIRYLILYKMGGMYVDFDYECINAFDNCIENHESCYFPLEPEAHCRMFGKTVYFNNALMLTPANHPFFERIITHLQTASINYTGNKIYDVLYSTGPLMLTNLYEAYDDKTTISFLPAELVSPLSTTEVRSIIHNTADKEKLEKKLENAIAIHYFFGSWVSNDT